MVDMLEGIDDEDKADCLDWINKFGNNGLSPLSHHHSGVYLKARNICSMHQFSRAFLSLAKLVWYH